MERRVAILASSTMTLAAATTSFVALGGIDLFGRAEIDSRSKVVVVTLAPPSAAGDTGPVDATTTIVTALPDPTPAVPRLVVPPPSGGDPTRAAVTTTDTLSPTTPGSATPTPTTITTPTATPTTAHVITTVPPTAPSTGTTLPPDARIPSDWPTGSPIPPIPPDCEEPVLEDNGIWNCDH